MAESDGRGMMMAEGDDGTGSGQQVMIPVEADFLYVYSTADGLCLPVCCEYSLSLGSNGPDCQFVIVSNSLHSEYSLHFA